MSFIKSSVASRATNFKKNAAALRSLGDDLRGKTAQISSGGSEEARQKNLAVGKAWSKDEEEKFMSPIRQHCEDQSNPYYAKARLWDDSVINLARTRLALELGISAALNTPIQPTKLGVFRM
jgi:3-methylcrotonyl-CoA carboxylase beta subunit